MHYWLKLTIKERVSDGTSWSVLLVELFINIEGAAVCVDHVHFCAEHLLVIAGLNVAAVVLVEVVQPVVHVDLREIG